MIDLISLISDVVLNPKIVDQYIPHAFYPSDASVEWEEDGIRKVAGSCLRQQYYRLLEVEEEPKPDNPQLSRELKCRAGNVMHDDITNLIKISGVYLGHETKMARRNPVPVSGRVDLWVLDKSTGRPVGVEVKTVGGYYPSKMYISGPNAIPKLEHALQSMVYLHHYSEWGVKEWIIFYIERADCSVKQHVLSIDENGSLVVRNDQIAEVWKHITADNIYARWIKLTKHLEEAELPPRDYVRQYSNEQLILMADKGELNKTDTERVKKKAQVLPGNPEPYIAKGDWPCAWCDYSTRCYSKNPVPSETFNGFNPIAKTCFKRPKNVVSEPIRARSQDIL